LPPAGEVYGCVEGGNGELGFTIVSDGTRKPYRVKVGPPCHTSGLDEMPRGIVIADVVAILAA
jgi:NADH:ubiquinone oxidoreductase subunit D